MTRPNLSIVDSVFKGITHSKARSTLVDEIRKHRKVHVQIIENLTHQGVPDIDACINGVVWSIEVKVRTDTLSDIQRLWLTGRLFAGGKCAIVHWRKDCISILDLTHKKDACLFRQDFYYLKDVVGYLIKRSEEF